MRPRLALSTSNFRLSQPLHHVIVALGATLITSLAAAASLSAKDVPDPLKAWVPWVLHGQDAVACPRVSAEAPQCVWPTRLSLSATRSQARFEMDVTVYGPTSSVSLPGGVAYWPLNVLVDGKPGVVVGQGVRPAVELTAGRHIISGDIEWKETPSSLQLPLNTGVVQLTVNGAPLTPRIEGDGRVWLQKDAAEQGAAVASDAVEVRVFRKVEDSVTTRLDTRLLLTVSGKPRELTLPGVLLPGFKPAALDSSLPARVDETGSLKLQARAGTWQVTVTGARYAPMKTLAAPQPLLPGVTEEVWSFLAQPSARQVTVTGASLVDAKQAEVPQEWQAVPAYRMRAGETLEFHETRRGEAPAGPNKLLLQRQLWLDFDGKQVTAVDQFDGEFHAATRLTPAVGDLGAATLDGQDQQLTRGQPEQPAGLFVGRGRHSVTAVSRVPRSGLGASATGWAADVHSATTTLVLPAGWTLFHATGVDSVTGSWVSKWTLRDVFFVMLGALGAWRLLGRTPAVLTLGAMALTWQMPGAPHLLWFVLLGVVALARKAAEGGRLQKVAKFSSFAVAAVLGLQLMSFGVNQVQYAMYPQLEQLDAQRAEMDGQPAAAPAPAHSKRKEPVIDISPRQESRVAAVPPPPSPPVGREPGKAFEARYGYELREKVSVRPRDLPPPLSRLDPDAKVPTGPGVPTWTGSEHQLAWSGPVKQNQSFDVLLLPPWATALLRLLGLAACVGALAAMVGWRGRLPDLRGPALQLGLAAALVGVGLTHPDSAQAMEAVQPPEAELPRIPVVPSDTGLLDELRQRLTQPSTCRPQCADISQLVLEPRDAALTLRMEIHVLAPTWVPLPGTAAQWQPTEVTLDGKPAVLRRSDDGVLQLALEPGVHTAVARGPLAADGDLQLSLHTAVRRVRMDAAGWTLSGLDARGVSSGTLQLTSATQKKASSEDKRIQDKLPPLMVVQRTLRMDLTQWTIRTNVYAVFSNAAPAIVKVPLLPGEAVSDETIRVEDGKAVVSWSGSPVLFTSSFKPVEQVRFQAGDGGQFLEVWNVERASVWDLTWKGPPPVSRDAGDNLETSWQPYPGETLELSVRRVAGAGGATTTVDDVATVVRPGQRSTSVTVSLRLRTSQPGNQRLDLPKGAQLETVRLNDQVLGLRDESGVLSVPLTKGAHRLELTWQEPRGVSPVFESSSLNLHADGVSQHIRIVPGDKRVVLAVGGPQAGPVVLFWGVALMLALVAWVLSRTKATPLGFWSWWLLGLGLTQASVPTMAGVFGWLFLLALRKKVGPTLWPRALDLFQLVLAGWTVWVIGALYVALSQGLLGSPEVFLTGANTTSDVLYWFADRVQGQTTTAWVLSVPSAAYRVVMMVWAAWLAFSLLKWLPWMAECVRAGAVWRPWRRPKAPA